MEHAGLTGPEADLLARARRGDVTAFGTLCDRHRARVWRIAASVARGSDAEDIAQEALVRAFRSLSGYLGHAPFEAWLCRIVVNVAHDHHRSAWKRKVLLFSHLPCGRDEPVVCPESEVQLRDLQRRVRRAVASLPDKQRSPIWLHYFEGFSLVEIARLDGTPEATVRSRIKAGLQRLSLSLDDLLPPQEEPRPLDAESRALETDPKGCRA